MENKMSNTQGLQKYWITACDEQRRVIFNKIITTGSVAEARMIAENDVPAECHGSICITDESNNPIVNGETGLPTLRTVAVEVHDNAIDPKWAAKLQADMTLTAFDRLEHRDRRQLAERRAEVERKARNTF